MAAPLIHLICGSTGAGKSTDARRLAAEIGAVHFSLDQWTAAPYWTGNPLPFAITRAMFDYVETGDARRPAPHGVMRQCA